jgi:hypothetical protein
MRSAYGGETLAGTGVMLVIGRPGVKHPDKEKKYLPPGEIKIIAMDYDKEMTPEKVKELRDWAKKIGIGF